VVLFPYFAGYSKLSDGWLPDFVAVDKVHGKVFVGQWGPLNLLDVVGMDHR